MKNLLFGLSFSLLASGAHAADVVVDEVVVVATSYDWSGVYIGGNIGYGWAEIDQAAIGEVILLGPAPVAESFDADGDGVVGGVQAVSTGRSISSLSALKATSKPPTLAATTTGR